MSGLPCAARTAAGVTCDVTFIVDENDGPYGTIPIRLRFETCRWLTAAGGLTLLTLVSLCELFDGSTWRPQPTHEACTSKVAVATRRRQENYYNFKARARIVVKKGGRCAPLVRERSKHNGDPLTRTEKAKSKKQKAKSKKQRAKSKTSKNEKEKTKSRAISGKEPTRPEANTTNYQLEDEGGVRFVPGDGSSWSNE